MHGKIFLLILLKNAACCPSNSNFKKEQALVPTYLEKDAQEINKVGNFYINFCLYEIKLVVLFRVCVYNV